MQCSSCVNPPPLAHSVGDGLLAQMTTRTAAASSHSVPADADGYDEHVVTWSLLLFILLEGHQTFLLIWCCSSFFRYHHLLINIVALLFFWLSGSSIVPPREKLF